METTKLKPFTLDASKMRRWYLQEAGAPRTAINIALILATRVIFILLGDPPIMAIVYWILYLAIFAYIAILASGLLSLNVQQKKIPYNEQTVEFDESSLTASYAGETGTMALKEITAAKEFKEFFALTIGKGRLWIPVSAFESEGDLSRFREDLQRETKYEDRRKVPLLSWQLRR